MLRGWSRCVVWIDVRHFFTGEGGGVESEMLKDYNFGRAPAIYRADLGAFDQSNIKILSHQNRSNVSYLQIEAFFITAFL